MPALPEEHELEPEGTEPEVGDLVVKTHCPVGGGISRYRVGDKHTISTVTSISVSFTGVDSSISKMGFAIGGAHGHIWRIMKRGRQHTTTIVDDYQKLTPAEEEAAFRKRRDEMWRKAMS